jgi:hypothetical protein
MSSTTSDLSTTDPSGNDLSANSVLPPSVAPSPPPKLTEVEVTNENVALNLLVSFVSLAQKRGAFSFDESAKIWECIKKFTKS